MFETCANESLGLDIPIIFPNMSPIQLSAETESQLYRNTVFLFVKITWCIAVLWIPEVPRYKKKDPPSRVAAAVGISVTPSE